jgi:Lon protease-like protein
MESSVEIPADHLGLVELLKSLQVHPAVRGLYSDIDYTDATEVSARLTELLPLDNEVKQSFFEIGDPLVRLIELEAEVTKLQIRGRDA